MKYKSEEMSERLKKAFNEDVARFEKTGNEIYKKSAEHTKQKIDAYTAGGFRERYAMENGNHTTVYINGHKCFKFTYSTKKEYQDANGATFDIVRGVWIA